MSASGVQQENPAPRVSQMADGRWQESPRLSCSPCFVPKGCSCACLLAYGAGASHWGLSGFQIEFVVFVWRKVPLSIPFLYEWQSHPKVSHDSHPLGPQRFHIWGISPLMLCCLLILMGRFPPVVATLLLDVGMTFGQRASVAEEGLFVTS